MSKSLGNVVDPFALIGKFGSNSVRSYFLSEGPLFKDSNFILENLVNHHNSFICDSYCKNTISIYVILVNIMSRTTGKKIMKSRNNKIPKPDVKYFSEKDH